MADQHIVVQSEHLSRPASKWLADRCKLVVCSHDAPEFFDSISNAVGLVVRTYTIVDQKLLDAAPNLKVIGRAGAGLDNIDLAACRNRNIQVVYTPDANTQAVVEYVITLLSNALRPRAILSSSIDINDWKYLRAQTCAKRQLSDLTLGILGLGRIGKRLAEVATAIGCTVIYNDLIDIPSDQRFSADPVSLEQLFNDADVVSIHIDGRASNDKFVSSALIKRMKADVVFINTSRGFVIDTLTLAKFLRDHPQALALIDVHEPEPFGSDYPLLGLSNAKLYPHLASRTQAAMENMSWVVNDVVKVLEGSHPQFPAPL
ncbi:MAG: hypothetical protein IH984_01950 [Planctomycetes bacterium]|nr:hypothetical protein [Planctomycetota bacterium]